MKNKYKKLNNNGGFAISAIIYGLSIMSIMLVALIMATVSSERANNIAFSEKIENELINYSQSEIAFSKLANSDYTQEFVVPEDEGGWYKVELWGAQGGGEYGGRGSYTSGIIGLSEGEKLFVYVGKHGETGTSGQETDVRVNPGNYDDERSVASRIMVAAGGGSAYGQYFSEDGIPEAGPGGTFISYKYGTQSFGGLYDSDFNLLNTEDDGDVKTRNGSLMGFLGLNRPGYTEEFNSYFHCATDGVHCTIIDSGVYADAAVNPAFTIHTIGGIFNKFGIDLYFNKPKIHYSDGAGDGFVPGAKEYLGGTSFIAGYTGYYKISFAQDYRNDDPSSRSMSTTDRTTYEIYERSESGSIKLLKSYHFYDGMMLPGVNLGDGRARITKIASFDEFPDTPPRKNTKLDNVVGIKYCISGNPAYTQNDTSYAARLYFTVNGFANREVTTTWESRIYHSENTNCNVVKLNEPQDLDDISLEFTDHYGQDIKNLEISVTSDRDAECLQDDKNFPCERTLKKKTSLTELSETQTFTGYRISAYQFDSSETLPDKGNYYIMPVLYENKALTASASEDEDMNPITVDYLNGYKRQQWYVERLHGNYFKVIELSRYKALQVYQDENKLGNKLVANESFNNLSENLPQIWLINPIGNGTYTIETAVSKFDRNVDSGFLVPQTDFGPFLQSVNSINGYKIANTDEVIIGKKNYTTQRFKFIETGFSSAE